jgi:glutathione S-transferase
VKLVIANKAYSSWSLRPWLLMRVLALPFDEVVIPLDAPGSRDAMLAYGPTGKVPVLVDGAQVVWDSLAIIEYLAERHPEQVVWPRDAAARALARSLAAEMHSGYLALRRALPMNMRRAERPVALEEPARSLVAADIGRIEAAWRDARTRFGADGPFLFGAFGAADAMFAPVVNRFVAYGVAVGAEARDYMAAVTALPAWRDWEAGARAEGWALPRIDDV